MDLQLNISIPKKEKKNTPAKAEKSKDFTFVSKPVFSGKTLARKRPTNHAPGKQFNFPKSNETTDTERPPQKSKFDKKFKAHETIQNDELEKNTSAYRNQKFKQNESDELIEGTHNHSEKLQNDENKNSKKSNARTPHKDNFIRGVSLDPKKAFISSLFKNNPSVPRIGQRAVKPIVEKVFSGKTFSDLNIHKHCIANLEQNLRLKELTTVQQKASPIMLQGRDVLIRSQTGSGKTLAYALPIVEALQAIRPKINRHNGIRVLVVVPTRELAVQTYELFVKLVKPFTWVVPGLLSGGQKRKAEKARLRKGLNILVGTPGRICDHLRHTESLNFGQTRCLILDEADRLLDMGYEKDVAAIVKALDDHNISSRTYDPNTTANNGGYDPMALMRASVNKKTVFADEEEAETPKEEVAEDIEEVTEEKQEIQEDKASGGKHNLTDVFHSKQRQTVLLSATLTKAVEKLAGLTMIDPVFVDASEGRTSVVADSLNNSDTPEEPETKSAKAGKKEKKQSPVKSEEEMKDKDDEVKPLKKGLKQFSGTSFPELFETDIKKEILETAAKPKIEDDSDSDSDYEYFKVQKKIQDTKQEVESEKEDTENEEQEEESAKVQKSDSFRDALKSALEDDELILPETVKQTFMITPMKLRLVTLASLIVEHCVINSKGGKMIVFVATQDMVDYHCDLLQAVLCGGVEKAGKRNEKKKAEKTKNSRKKGQEKLSSDEESKENGDSDFEIEIPTERDPGGLITLEIEFFKLHGSMKHEDRIDVFKEFRSAKNGVLFCTDVAARGLDLPRVDLVLQYCAPASATDYVHRVGRTGRAACSGEACLFLLPSEAEFVRHLESKRIRLKQADDAAALSPLTYLVPGQQPHRAAIAVQSRAESIVAGSKGWLEQGSKAFTSWVRFYAGYPRAVKEFLDRGELHLGHAAKAFGLRDSPAAVGRRVKHDTVPNEKPNNRLTVERTQKIRQQPPKLGPGKRRWTQSSRNVSEYDSGLQSKSKKKKD